MFTIGAFGIITDEKDRVLLCHRRAFDLWNLPGGRVEVGESPWSALVREIEEETCLKVVPVHLSGVYSKTEMKLYCHSSAKLLVVVSTSPMRWTRSSTSS